MANIKSRIKFKRATTAGIAASADILLEGAPVFNTDTKELLIGNGTTPANSGILVKDAKNIISGGTIDGTAVLGTSGVNGNRQPDTIFESNSNTIKKASYLDGRVVNNIDNIVENGIYTALWDSVGLPFQDVNYSVWLISSYKNSSGSPFMYQKAIAFSNVSGVDNVPLIYERIKNYGTWKNWVLKYNPEYKNRIYKTLYDNFPGATTVTLENTDFLDGDILEVHIVPKHLADDPGWAPHISPTVRQVVVRGSGVNARATEQVGSSYVGLSSGPTGSRPIFIAHTEIIMTGTGSTTKNVTIGGYDKTETYDVATNTTSSSTDDYYYICKIVRIR